MDRSPTVEETRLVQRGSYPRGRSCAIPSRRDEGKHVTEEQRRWRGCRAVWGSRFFGGPLALLQLVWAALKFFACRTVVCV